MGALKSTTNVYVDEAIDLARTERAKELKERSMELKDE